VSSWGRGIHAVTHYVTDFRWLISATGTQLPACYARRRGAPVMRSIQECPVGSIALPVSRSAERGLAAKRYGVEGRFHVAQGIPGKTINPRASGVPPTVRDGGGTTPTMEKERES